MEATKILTSDVLDIIFEGRNKEYGAYELRKSYNKRLVLSMGLLSLICSLAFISVVMADKRNVNLNVIRDRQDKTLSALPKPKEPIPPPVPPANSEPPRMEVTRVTPPVIVVDQEVRAEELPPLIDDIFESKIGTFNQDGAKDIGFVAPPVETKSAAQVIVPGKQEQDFEKTFTKVENPAQFPGGQIEWMRYLQNNLKYPDAAIENGNENVVRVQFIVDREGNISEVVALNDPGDGLAQEAVRIIKQGPKWIPAEQNGKKVIYRHIQSIAFRLG